MPYVRSKVDPTNPLGLPPLKKKEDLLLMRKAPNESLPAPATAPPIVDDVLTQSGQPLERATRTFMEARLGYDFSRVRVHSDARANASARSIHAHAYTVGEDIVFDAGRFAPQTREGRRLLAHELTHVVQQGGCGVRCPQRTGPVDGDTIRPLRTADATTRAGHDFGKVPVYSDTRADEPAPDTNAFAYSVLRDGVIEAGQFGKAAETLPLETQPIKQPKTPTPDTEPTPLDNPPVQGPAIAVTNGWANPAGKPDRTTVGIGELNSFVVSDVAGGSWKSADGKGKTTNSVSFQWTASAAGTNAITYTAADKSTSSVTMTTEVPSKLTGKKDSDLTFSAGTQGAGMELTVTVSPTTVSFQALELMEGTCNASAISGYFSSHAPGPHDAAAGAGKWRQVGTDNDVSDTADSSGWPSPWSKGSYTWSIPASWRLKGAQTSTAFSANNDQVVTITGADGTTTVTKLGAATTPRKP